MNLYLISQKVNTGYDAFSSAVVAAPSETYAKHMYPGTGEDICTEEIGPKCSYDWTTNSQDVTAKFLGVADSSITEPYVICADYDAG